MALSAACVEPIIDPGQSVDAQPSGAGAFEHNLDAAVLRVALRRVVQGNRIRVAEPFAEMMFGWTSEKTQAPDSSAVRGTSRAAAAKSGASFTRSR